MTGFIACLAGLLGMLGLWSLAWWLWKQAALPPSTTNRRRRPGWPSQPIPKRTPSIPPPSWLFAPVGVDPLELDDAPAARERPSSSANTSRYLRAASDDPRTPAERTEVLADNPRFDVEQPALERTDATSKIGGRTRKIGLISMPGPLPDE
jgi:hypothetical protein